ncbi:hypothetical protein HWV62_967 [Athelia sp. TMB]|nr:hypothetical protein HWV62_967 [Athelia sp. TMB]
MLIISTAIATGEDTTGLVDFDLLMCAPHFIGDGTSLHQSTHELLCIVTSSKSDTELIEELGQAKDWRASLPPAYESRLSGPKSAIGKAAAKVNFLQMQGKEIGGHTFSRQQRGPKTTALIEHAFTKEQTVKILAHCKSNKVQADHVSRMMYTAVNLRSHLSPIDASTYWFLALTYYNIVLPSFLPASPAVFWHRARSAKAQTLRTTTSPYLVSRALQMSKTRGSRARGEPQPPPPAEALAPPAPSAALIGLSLIGNLDRTYVRASYPSSLELQSVTTASRLKPGGMLLLEHTFGEKLWLHLCWDEMGFEDGQVERFWEELKKAVEEYLC